jgi:hypothetical protein
MVEGQRCIWGEGWLRGRGADAEAGSESGSSVKI